MRQILPLCLTAALACGQAYAAPPPHAWLFGIWTGGLFPVVGEMTQAQCVAQPAMIFGQDQVSRASLTSSMMAARDIVTVRAMPGGTEFHFTPLPPAPPADTLQALQKPADPRGFGCESPDILHVQKISENEIAFPGCADFPYPLVRCPSR